MAADRVHFRDATVTDIGTVADELRAADRAELRAMHGPNCDFFDLVAQSACITPNLIAMVDTQTDEALCVFGVVPIPGTLAGCPWMLGTDRAQRFGRELVLHGRAYVERWASEFTGVENFVHAENCRSVRWLQALGFRMGEPQVVGGFGGMFRRFWR